MTYSSSCNTATDRNRQTSNALKLALKLGPETSAYANSDSHREHKVPTPGFEPGTC